PGAAEICNGIDDDCDGTADNGITFTTYYADADGDGYGDASVETSTCDGAPSGYVSDATDCDDTDGAINPGAAEICNGIDDDCDGTADEGVLLTFYLDADNDRFGNVSSTIQACSPPAGYVANGNDCNDSNNAVYPGATELCNGIDDNCNGQIDEGSSRLSTYYADADGDGFGNVNVTIEACSAPPGYVTNRTDCDDTNPAVHPDATEICNGIDDNCKRGVDEDSKPDRPQSISGLTVVCKNATGLVYSTPLVSGVTAYNWSVTNATIMSGQGTNTIIVNWSNKNGKVKVSLTNNCGTSQEEFLNVSAANCNAKQNADDEESAENENTEFRVKVYPNPFSDVFHLNVSGLEEENLSIRIYDILGQLIESRISIPFESDITFGTTLAKGVYLLEVNQGDKVQVIRIVKSE
ncbi:MAG: MopE-related protein, partial [Bacteroidota bacterium]